MKQSHTHIWSPDLEPSLLKDAAGSRKEVKEGFDFLHSQLRPLVLHLEVSTLPWLGPSSDLRGKLRNPGPLQVSSAVGLTLIWDLIPGKEINLLIALSMSGFYMLYPVYSL